VIDEPAEVHFGARRSWSVGELIQAVHARHATLQRNGKRLRRLVAQLRVEHRAATSARPRVSRVLGAEEAAAARRRRPLARLSLER
jgi:hypothetical protein